MLTIKEVIRTLYNALSQNFTKQLKNHRGDWNQNNPAADDYIKNRPFYKSDDLVTLVNTTFTTYDDYEWCAPFYFELTEGTTYYVTYNGIQYQCKAYMDQYGTIDIGNLAIAGEGADTGEPFFYWYLSDFDNGTLIEKAGTHTISIKTKKIVKINKEFLPNDLVSIDEISGAFDSIYDEMYSIPNVSYGYIQNLSTAEKTTARNNIGAVSSDEITGVVKYSESQTLTEDQKEIARMNIGAGVPYTQVQADWNENDSTSVSYINNRTHYLEILSEDAIGYRGTTGSVLGFNNDLYDLMLDAYNKNTKLTFIINDEIYTSKIKIYEVNSSTILLYIGNLSQSIINSGRNTNENYVLELEYNYGGSKYQYTTRYIVNGEQVDADLVVTSIDNILVHELDARYIPNVPRTFFILYDQVSGIEYRVAMRDGSLTTYAPIRRIEIYQPPNKTVYAEGEYFDPTGMVILSRTTDGHANTITDYKIDERYTNSYLRCDDNNENVYVRIFYTDEDSVVYTTYLLINVIPFDAETVLVDFEYIANEDGTYTLTGWKGTLNGEASTEMIIPDNPLIIV